VRFFNTHGLPGKDLTEIDFLLAQTDTPATGDYDGFIVQGIVDVRQSTVGTLPGCSAPPAPASFSNTGLLLC
jgi:hypothetical protein